VLAAALPVFFVALGANTIWEANEAFYVETPQHMLETGDYITPYFNGLPRLNKPVLSYWIVAGLYRLFGVSVAVERLGIALGALGIIACAFVIGRTLRSTSTGLLAALIVATSPRVVVWSRRIFIDIYITLFMSIALACFLLAERYPEVRRRWLVLMYAAIGLGVLTKGPVALFFPVVVFGVWLVTEKRWRQWMTFMPGWGALIVLAIVCPWYIGLYHAHGWAPIVQFFVGENIERFAAPEFPEGRSIFFYVPVLLTDLFPWAPLLVVTLVSAWRRTGPEEDAVSASLRRLLWLWIVTIAGVFSFSQSKQDLYIFPVVAAAAALIAETIQRALDGERRTAFRVISIVTAALILPAAAAGYWLFGAGYFALAGAGAAALVLSAGAIAIITSAARGRLAAVPVLWAATFLIFNYVLVLRILPALEPLKPSAALGQLMRERGGENGNFGHYHFSLPSLSYYAGRPITELGDLENVKAFFLNDQGAWVVMTEDSFRKLRQDVSMCEVARRPMFSASLPDLAARRPPRDVLLVSNRGCDATSIR